MRWALVCIMFLALAAGAHAVSYSLTAEPLDNEILRNETATFDALLTSFGDAPASFQAYTIDPTWNVGTEPLDLSIPPRGKRAFEISLRPTSATSYGMQGIIVNFKELNSDVVMRKTLVVTLQNPNPPPPRDYEPTVTFDVLMPYDIDPRNPVPLRLELRNRNALNIENLSITITSPHFEAKTSVALGPLSEKTKDIEDVKIPATTSPREEELSVKLEYRDSVIGQVTKNYRIIAYSQMRQRVTQDGFLFKTVRTVDLTNDGNIKSVANVTVPTSLLKSMFVSSSLPYELDKREGQRVLLWSIPLDPYGTTEFTYTENYRILILLLLIAVISMVAYFLLRSPVVAIKEAVAVPHPEGVSDIKVRVFVRNRSSKIIQGIQMTDKVPSLADVVKTESPGSLAPSKIATSDKQGTLLRWELDVLEPYEERILSYQIKSKLKIIGRMKLPNAKVRFVHKNKERAIFSNNIELVEKFSDR